MVDQIRVFFFLCIYNTYLILILQSNSITILLYSFFLFYTLNKLYNYLIFNFHYSLLNIVILIIIFHFLCIISVSYPLLSVLLVFSLMPLSYCQCCKLNHEQGKGHIYSVRHIKKLEEWSERQKKRVSDCIVLAQNIYVNTIATDHSFWCAFCGKEIKDQAPMLV